MTLNILPVQAIRRGLQLAGPNFANFLDALQELLICWIRNSRTMELNRELHTALPGTWSKTWKSHLGLLRLPQSRHKATKDLNDHIVDSYYCTICWTIYWNTRYIDNELMLIIQYIIWLHVFGLIIGLQSWCTKLHDCHEFPWCRLAWWHALRVNGMAVLPMWLWGGEVSSIELPTIFTISCLRCRHCKVATGAIVDGVSCPEIRGPKLEVRPSVTICDHLWPSVTIGDSVSCT